MPKCNCCGKKGFLLKLYEGGICYQCLIAKKKDADSKAESPAPTVPSIVLQIDFQRIYEHGQELDYAYQPQSESDEAVDLLDDFTVIDVETTGLSPNSDAIIQLSAVRYIHHKEHSAYSTCINPQRHIPSKVTELTGIDDAMVADAPTFAQVSDSFFRFISDSPILTGYNFSFDLRFLSAAAGFQLQEQYRCFDTLAIARREIHGLCSYKLCDVSSYIGFSTKFHDSLNDCRACGEIIKFLVSNNVAIDLSLLEFESESNHCSEHLNHLQDYKSRLCSTECPIDLARITPNGPLAGKNIVFTGVLSFGRSTASKMATLAGAFVKSGVSKKTDYLVVGEQDTELVGADGMSTKEERAYQLINEYGIQIKIIGETEYLRLLTSKGDAVLNG